MDTKGLPFRSTCHIFIINRCDVSAKLQQCTPRTGWPRRQRDGINSVLPVHQQLERNEHKARDNSPCTQLHPPARWRVHPVENRWWRVMHRVLRVLWVFDYLKFAKLSCRCRVLSQCNNKSTTVRTVCHHQLASHRTCLSPQIFIYERLWSSMFSSTHAPDSFLCLDTLPRRRIATDLSDLKPNRL